jgi:tRNA pseudouridine13 synthase
VKLYPSVVQSEIFNRYLTLRSAEGAERLLDGDVVRLRGSQAVFLVESAESESARFRQRDILLTGPIWGPKQRAAAGRAAELENEAAQQAGADANVLATLAKFAPGTRRDLFVFPESIEVTAPAADRIELAFTLPSGSYATVLVRELTRRASAESDAREA